MYQTTLIIGILSSNETLLPCHIKIVSKNACSLKNVPEHGQNSRVRNFCPDDVSFHVGSCKWYMLKGF